jgi:hypothetical protein
MAPLQGLRPVTLCTIFLFIAAAAPFIRRDCLLPLVPPNPCRCCRA